MINRITQLKNLVEQEFSEIKNAAELEQFRLKHLVKKGTLQELFDIMKELPKEEKIAIGKDLNLLKKFTEEKFAELKEQFEAQTETEANIDLTLPGRRSNKGTRHPVSQTILEMIDIFESLGFTVAEGPDIEDGVHNFDSLNFPPDHPARDMQDTFFIKDDRELVLRTHTSPVQVRMMENKKPPIRSIMPGRVYRNEALDATHLAEFHQIEGLYIDKNVTLAELKATMVLFAKRLYGNDITYRFRPSFFPFTEPSAEMDVMRANGKWMEIVGCGMVHPNVLRAGGIDPEIYSGYAFGFGIERVTMLKTGLDDIRLLYDNDLRVLTQF